MLYYNNYGYHTIKITNINWCVLFGINSIKYMKKKRLIVRTHVFSRERNKRDSGTRGVEWSREQDTNYI